MSTTRQRVVPEPMITGCGKFGLVFVQRQMVDRETRKWSATSMSVR